MKIVELVISIKKTNLILFNRNTQLYDFHKNATKTEGKPTFRNRRVDRRVEKVLRCLTNANHRGLGRPNGATFGFMSQDEIG